MCHYYLCVFLSRYAFTELATCLEVILEKKNDAIVSQLLSRWYWMVDQNWIHSQFDPQHHWLTRSPTLTVLLLSWLTPNMSTTWRNFIFGFIPKTLCHILLTQLLCYLAFVSLFFPFPFFMNGFSTTTLPLRPFLIRLQWTMDGSTEGPYASVRSCTFFQMWLSHTINLSFVFILALLLLLLSSPCTVVLNYLRDTLHTVLWYDRFSANKSLGITLLMQKLCYLCHFS